MDLPNDTEMLRMFREQADEDPELVQRYVDDPAVGLELDSVHHPLSDIVEGRADGDVNRWYLTKEAQVWVRQHAAEITPT